ncbi:hypothetical protein BDV38DRAFT_295802 [Aspergillus pseudotamarii]|uniref:C2H2-type domain-containing protein n=1 Tax=Aspergillus pseudotamarii TaxID=132259 RepID=A0A5N6T6S9_ASPPS|nr:uncharacterized protein BDV38DRAFT_295802 [Aspergillus pseudotamarii]KAE8142045.1 hypothetical protein BDV38DRAFT_295802 [Aspergillus pseudotamarii]
MNYNHNVQEEQWMTLPLINRAPSSDISRNVSMWSHPESLPEPPLQWFMDPSSHGELLETPVQWPMDASALGHTLNPSTPWIIHSPALDNPAEPSVPWIMDTSGLKGFPEPQIQGLCGLPVLQSHSDSLTASSSRIPDVPAGSPSRDEQIFSRPGGNGHYRDSPPELLLGHITPSDSISLAHVKCPVPGYKSTERFANPRDIRRPYRQHVRAFFCHYENCPQSAPPDSQSSSTRGFATRKDRDRHEAKHKPEIRCQWRNQHGEQCTRLFSRMDNMRDHIRRIHRRKF